MHTRAVGPCLCSQLEVVLRPPAAFTPEAFSKVTGCGLLRTAARAGRGGRSGGQCVCEAGSAGLVLGGSHHKTGTVTSTSPEPVHPNPSPEPRPQLAITRTLTPAPTNHYQTDTGDITLRSPLFSLGVPCLIPPFPLGSSWSVLLTLTPTLTPTLTLSPHPKPSGPLGAPSCHVRGRISHPISQANVGPLPCHRATRGRRVRR